MVVHGKESIEFEKVGDIWLAKRFSYVQKPPPPVAIGPYVLTVHVSFPDEENMSLWLQCVQELASSVHRDEPGCLTFSVSHDTKDPLKVLLLERYVDRHAFEIHKRTDAFKSFVQSLKSIKR